MFIGLKVFFTLIPYLTQTAFCKFHTIPFQSGNLYHMLLDSTLTVTVVHSMNITFWRGTWTLLDLSLYPDDFQRSAWSCLGIGVGFTILAYLLQLIVYPASKQLDRQVHILIEFNQSYLYLLSN